ncbi:MAG: TonB-dependent receptor plug domain-containing protein, partial [Acidobacteriales bacterium]|nr:TonB-dependent receptor plug domain-containing protein [Terriglobales bacterium]
EDVLRNTPVASSVVDRSLIETLPTESVNAPLSSLVTLSTPGIASDSNGMFHPLGEHADTSVSVDGQPITDQQSRTFSNQLPVSAIQSINVINGAIPPEYGDKASLVVETTTRSGLGNTPPHGSVSFGYGSFGSSNGNVSVGFGGKRFGNFISLDGVNSGRYLDTPEFRPLHDHGNAENIFDRIDFQSPNAKDSLHLNLLASRSWFQQPNQFDQQAVGQDERARILSYDVSPSWTHLFSEHALLSVNPYIRQDQFEFYPSRNIFSELPAFLQQARRLQNAGLKTDFSFSKGIHNLKAGVNWYHTFLKEDFSVGITDPTFNDPASPGFLPGLLPFDLTRGGTPFVFNGHTDIKQEAFYLQDNISWRQFTFVVGARGDVYNGLSQRSMFEPRLGLSYNVPGTGTVLRAAYSRVMMTPYNENLILSSSTGVGGLAANAGAFGVHPLRPAARNQYNAGVEQAFGKHLIVDADYVWKYTDPDYDFDVLFNTPLTFPIQWRKSKIDGLAVRVTVPTWHGMTAYSVLGHTRSRFFGPEVGGIIFNDPALGTSTLPFRIDHDQAFQQTTHLQYQPKPNTPWFSFNWRYESGLVAGRVPFATDTTTPVDLTGLTADQQQQIELTCGGVRATLAAPLSSCASTQLASPLVKIPAPGTENDDRNPPRIQPRTLFDLGTGWDNVFHKDRYKTNLTFTVVNLTDKVALYNFQSTFSGTHYVTPRTYTGAVTFNF